MFLINAIYFKGTWQYQFDPKAHAPSSFRAADCTVQTVPFMNRPENMKPKFRAGGTQQRRSPSFRMGTARSRWTS